MGKNLELMNALDFTPQELEANKEGYLTKRQRHRLSDERSFWRFFDRLIKAASPILIILAALDGIRIGDTISSRAVIISLMCIITFTLLLYIGTRWRKLDKDLSKGDVTAVEGIVKLTRFRKRNGMAYRIYIHQEYFDVPGHIYIAFEQGKSYALYFTPHSRTLISAEQLN
ncbi:MAG: hypothetical protein K8L99_14550 [Anaerolineae bacterium]|nr:hypothetical protein [Anaerolineae bacterium]